MKNVAKWLDKERAEKLKEEKCRKENGERKKYKFSVAIVLQYGGREGCQTLKRKKKDTCI